MLVKIKRQDTPGSEPYWQSFSCELPETATVAALLDRINYDDDPVDVNGNSARRIRWECSCLQKVCGACAMLINGRPALACDTFIGDIEEPVVLEPLSKFRVVSDLIVDRSRIFKSLEGLCLEQEAGFDKNEFTHQYAVAKCLKCGLCLEACPNYTGGELFFGAVFANDAYLAASQSDGERKKDIKKLYREHFEKGCSKALSCMAVCPAAIPTLASFAKLNRR